MWPPLLFFSPSLVFGPPCCYILATGLLLSRPFISVMLFPPQGSDEADFPNFLLPSRYTFDYRSDRGIRRKFSQLKLIKIFLRSSVQRERLNILTIVFIESEMSRGLNLDKVLKDIANAKTRKTRFTWQMHYVYRRLQ